MQFKILFTLGLASLATANNLDRRDSFAINAAIKMVNPAITALDQSIAAITAGNVATQMDAVKTKAVALNEAIIGAAAKLKGTSALRGPTDSVSLVSAGSGTVKALNSTLLSVSAKRQLILDAKQDGKLRDVLVALKPGLLAIIDVMPSQMYKNPIQGPDAADLMAGITGKSMAPFYDIGVETLMRSFRGDSQLSALLGGFGGAGGGGAAWAGLVG